MTLDSELSVERFVGNIWLSTGKKTILDRHGVLTHLSPDYCQTDNSKVSGKLKLADNHSPHVQRKEDFVV